MTGKAKPRLRFDLHIAFDLKPDGPSYSYQIKGDGTESFVCPEHAKTTESIRDCVLDNVLMLFQAYALEDDNKLSKDAIALKQRLLNMATVKPDTKGR